MTKPNTSNIPGIGAMGDTFDFIKNLWGSGMSMPGITMPTLSVDEINKQIADLKAVESWLTLNMNMLRTTIQSLEVQSATLSTLQAMSETMSASFNPKTAEQGSSPQTDSAFDGSKAKRADSAAPPPLGNPTAWWNMLQDQFKQAVKAAGAEVPPPAPAAKAKAAPRKRKVTKRAAPKRQAI